MPKFVIEREIRELESCRPWSCGGSRRSRAACCAIWGHRSSGSQSFVTADKVYCVYLAPREKLVREQRRQGGFPANSVARVLAVIDPTTAET